uniref:Uncharacterized protein n=1 Tax=Anopheles farauti TaxID=69004 RepID=A0A182QV82_9DIPT
MVEGQAAGRAQTARASKRLQKRSEKSYNGGGEAGQGRAGNYPVERCAEPYVNLIRRYHKFGCVESVFLLLPLLMLLLLLLLLLVQFPSDISTTSGGRNRRYDESYTAVS